MPLVKQGKFREYYDQCEKIKEMEQDCHNQYFDENGCYECAYDVFSEFFYSVDDVYKEAVELKAKVESLLEIAEQKTEESIGRCEQCVNDLEDVIRSCLSDFRSVYDLYNHDFSDVELETFQNYRIYKEIM